MSSSNSVRWERMQGVEQKTMDEMKRFWKAVTENTHLLLVRMWHADQDQEVFWNYPNDGLVAMPMQF